MRKIPSRFTVHVNKTNIRRGKKEDAEDCAVSKAIQREIHAKRRGIRVEVFGGNDITIIDDNGEQTNYKCYTTRVTERINRFITKFDDGPKRLCRPTKFRLKRVA